MNLIIAGHPRSGTTLLNHLCNGHPDVALTFEFGNYLPLGRPYARYVRRMRKRIWRIRRRPGILPDGRQPAKWLRSQLFALRYLWLLGEGREGLVDAHRVEAALQRLFGGAKYVGDKFPGYVFQLDRIVAHPGVVPVIIYRDGRDVASSTLRKARGTWSNARFAQKVNSAEKVARRWNQAIEIMERHQESALIVRYEDLVSDPGAELARLAQSLQLDPSGFPASLVHASSVGKYQKGLTRAELDCVNRIAGPTLQRLGYSV